MSKQHQDPSQALDAIAASLKRVARTIENREKEGARLTAAEIHSIANQLQLHADTLVAASKHIDQKNGDH